MLTDGASLPGTGKSMSDALAQLESKTEVSGATGDPDAELPAAKRTRHISKSSDLPTGTPTAAKSPPALPPGNVAAGTQQAMDSPTAATQQAEPLAAATQQAEPLASMLARLRDMGLTPDMLASMMQQGTPSEPVIVAKIEPHQTS